MSVSVLFFCHFLVPLLILFMLLLLVSLLVGLLMYSLLYRSNIYIVCQCLSLSATQHSCHESPCRTPSQRFLFCFILNLLCKKFVLTKLYAVDINIDSCRGLPGCTRYARCTLYIADAKSMRPTLVSFDRRNNFSGLVG